MMSITQLQSLDNFKSLFDFQYFVCPLCPFKWRSKQGFIDHVWQKHPVLVEKMKNLQDDSMDGVILPWNQMNSDCDLTGKNNIQQEEEIKTIMEIKDESLDGDTRKVVSDDKNSEELKCNDCGKLFTSKDSLKIHRSLNCEHMNKQPAGNTDITNFEGDEDSGELNFVLRFTNFKCAKCKLLYNILSAHPCTSLQKIKLCLDVKTAHENDNEIYDDNSLGITDHTPLESKLVEMCSPLKTENNFNNLVDSLSEKGNSNEVQEGHHRQKEFKCKLCEKLYTSDSSLKKHIADYHVNKPLKCETCGKVFHRKFEWKQHVSLHGDNDYKCDFCEKSFIKNQFLEHHVYTTHKAHKEEQPSYVCGTCSKRYKSYSSLKIHVQKVHEGKKDQCKVCGISYSDKSRLTRHVQRVHEKLNMKTHICETCGKGITNAAALREHKRAVHDGHKDHACEQCGKTYGHRDTLRKHFNAHHKGEKLYRYVVFIFTRVPVYLIEL